MKFQELYDNLVIRMNEHDEGDIAVRCKLTVSIIRAIKNSRLAVSVKTLDKISAACDDLEVKVNEK